MSYWWWSSSKKSKSKKSRTSNEKDQESEIVNVIQEIVDEINEPVNEIEDQSDEFMSSESDQDNYEEEINYLNLVIQTKDKIIKDRNREIDNLHRVIRAQDKRFVLTTVFDLVIVPLGMLAAFYVKSHICY